MIFILLPIILLLGIALLFWIVKKWAYYRAINRPVAVKPEKKVKKKKKTPAVNITS